MESMSARFTYSKNSLAQLDPLSTKRSNSRAQNHIGVVSKHHGYES